MVLAGVDSPSRTSPVDRTNLNHSSPLTFRDQRQRTGLHHSYKKYSTTSSQTDIVDFVEQIEAEPEIHTPVFTWHRSASCKELHKPQELPAEVEKPQPKHERNFLITSSKTPSLDRTGVEQDTKVYSSSYPGTTSSLSTESADELEPGGSVLVMDTGSSREFSHDDLSHDSYELLEREVRSYVHSRSCSLGSSGEALPDDEIFVIDDYKDDVEKRLGYVEPRYRDIGFNEFNEKCKENIRKSREKMMENAEFEEYETKRRPGNMLNYEENERYPVERTKSEPFVSDFWRVARQHRKLFHQKSFDYTPTDSMDSESRNQASKSSIDIPYTLIKRQQMNGTATCYECRSPASPRKSPDRKTGAEIERKKSIKNKNRLSKTKQDSDLNSQDSGLSLSLGTESVDDLISQNTKNNVLTVKSDLKPPIASGKRDLLKVKSEDGPRTKGVLVKSKALSADSDMRKTPSFERNPPVEVIKIDSQDGEGIVICSSDDKNISIDSSDPDVIIVEYKTSRKRAFQKRGSSDSKSSFEGRKVSSFDSQRSDSDTSHKRDKYRDWKSESSSSCDLPERSDFRRERFSKEIKTSIEGKVVRETKEEREIKKQRSEEMERQKVEKLVKSKSESIDRTHRQTSLDLKKSLLDMAGRTHGFCTCDHDEKKLVDKKGKSMDPLVENKEEPVGILKTDYLKPPERTFMSNVTTVKADVNIIKDCGAKNKLEHMKRTEIYSDAENDDVFLDTKKPDDSFETKDESTRLRKDVIVLDSGTDLKNTVQICTDKRKELIKKEPPLKAVDINEKAVVATSNKKDITTFKTESSFPTSEQSIIIENVGGEVMKNDIYFTAVEKKSVADKNIEKDSKTCDIIHQEVGQEDKYHKTVDSKKTFKESTNVNSEVSKNADVKEGSTQGQVKCDIVDSSLKESKSEKPEQTKQITSPEMVWKKFGELPSILDKRERSPILFARLGFSEGSAFSPTHSQSPSSSRRAKSLDAPVVSLHRLPPITSFSSKDDTVDNDEGIELEEKSLRTIKPVPRENVIEEEDVAHLSPVTPVPCVIPALVHENKKKLENTDISSSINALAQELSLKTNLAQKLASPMLTPEETPLSPTLIKTVPLSPTLSPKVPLSPTLTPNVLGSPSLTPSVPLSPSSLTPTVPLSPTSLTPNVLMSPTTRPRKRSGEPAPLVINNDKVPSESVNTDDDTKSSPCTVAEISPDFNKTSPGKNSLNLSDSDQALPDPKKLHSRFLLEVDKLSNASDEQKVPDAEGFEYDSPRKPSETGEYTYDNDVFEYTDEYTEKDVCTSESNVPCVLEITQDNSTQEPSFIGDSLLLGAKDSGNVKGLSPDVSRKSSASDISRKSSASDISRRQSNASNPSRKSSNSEAFDGEVPEVVERRPSTRQERLDSFKNTKSYSVEIWTSEETDGPCIPTVDVEDWGNDDDAFAPDPIEALKEHFSPKETTFPEKDREFFTNDDEHVDQSHIFSEDNFQESEDQTNKIGTPESAEDRIPEICAPPTPELERDEDNLLVEEIIPLSQLCEKIEEPSQLDIKMIPPKRSFDEDVSSSSSGMAKPEKNTWKPFSLESSGSSSLEEGIFPPDDCSHFADEEEGSSNSAKEEYQGFGYSVVGADSRLMSAVYTGASGPVFGLSRTLSRISERSTTSEQERSDFEDDISTKPSSRSLSVEDESLISSDRQPSLSSDPSTNPEIEEHPLPPLPPEPLGFKIPPPLLNPEDEWPSPPNSSFETPVISNVEAYYMDIKPEEATKVVIPRDLKPQYESSSDSDYENKTLQDDVPESSTVETTVKLAVKPKRQGNSSDTSLGISDFSSSTSTVKHQYYSCTVKSDDSSLAEFGSSLSTEMLTSSRKNSDDSSCLRRRSYHAHQRSFDDYDSPYSESDESSRHNRRAYVNLPSPTSGGSGSLTPRKGSKPERRKEERRPGVKSIARSKCYSYYSLARSPPSDGSSSSLELGEPPTTPNTIPRVSKRRRHVPPSKRRHRASADMDMRDGHLISVSSPSVVACGKCHGRAEANRSQMSKQSSV